MKRIVFILILFNILFADDYTMLSMFSPSSMSSRQICFSARHRFYGDIFEKPLDSFFGMDEGANVMMSLRYHLFQGLEIKGSYTRLRKEKTIGLAYRIERDNIPLKAQVDIEYFSYSEPGLTEERRSNTITVLSIRSDPVWDRLSGALNFGYDGYFKRAVIALGLFINIYDDFGMFGSIDGLFEYYPVIDRETQNEKLAKYMLPSDVVSLGVKMDTYGHRFVFVLSKSTHFHLRWIDLGTDEDSFWKFGFNIERILKIY